MKMVKFLTISLIAVAMLSACKKENNDGGGGGGDNGGIDSADQAKADSFKTYIAGKQFQIKKYYSDQPIDYDTTDTEVKAETDLWPYVSLWLKDDQNSFNTSTGKVTIIQGADKIPGNDADEIVGDFSIGADKDGPYFNFLNYMYQPLKYRLVEFTSDHFIVYADWGQGAKVYTEFDLLVP